MDCIIISIEVKKVKISAIREKIYDVKAHFMGFNEMLRKL